MRFRVKLLSTCGQQDHQPSFIEVSAPDVKTAHDLVDFNECRKTNWAGKQQYVIAGIEWVEEQKP